MRIAYLRVDEAQLAEALRRDVARALLAGVAVADEHRPDLADLLAEHLVRRAVHALAVDDLN